MDRCTIDPKTKTIDTDVEIKRNCVKKKWIKAIQMLLCLVLHRYCIGHLNMSVSDF